MKTESVAHANHGKAITVNLPEWVGTKLMTVIGILIVAACYFSGYVRRQAYLDRFHVSVNAFPMDQPGYLVEGARGYGSFVFGLVSGSKYSWLGLVMCFVCSLWVAYVWFLMRTVLGFPRRGQRDAKPSLTRGFLSFIRSSLMVVLGSTIPAVVISLPGIVGGVSGMHAGIESKADFDKGCARAEATCVSLMTNSKPVAQGFRIAQSKDRIALYVNGITQEYELSGKEIATISK